LRLNRTDKEKLVDDIRDRFARSDAAFLAEYKGIKAVSMGELRRELRDASIEFKIVRNTLARRAVAGTPSEHLTEHLKGAVALVFSYSDAAVAAKKLTRFAKDQPNLKLLVGTLGDKPIGLDDIKGLSELPSKDVLLAKMLGSMKAPVTGLVGVLSGVPRKLVYALNAIHGQKAAAG
jgi:large subunit ribosomal protein L10